MSVRRYRIPKTYGTVISYKTSIFNMSRKNAPFLERTHISKYNRRSMAITCFTDRGSAAMGRYDPNNRKQNWPDKRSNCDCYNFRHTKLRRRSTTRNSVLQRNCPGLHAVRGKQAVSGYKLSVSTGSQGLQAVRGYRLSAATSCQQLQAVRRYRQSGATGCLRPQTVRGYRLSDATDCQRLQAV